MMREMQENTMMSEQEVKREMKMELWEKCYEDIQDEKKRVSGVILDSRGARVINLGKDISYKRIDILWKNEDRIEEWCVDRYKNNEIKLPENPRFFISMKARKLVAAELYGDKKEPDIYVCGRNESDDKVILLELITLTDGYIFQYWSGWTHTPHIHFSGTAYDPTLADLYNEMRYLIVGNGVDGIRSSDRGSNEYGLSEIGF